MISQLSKSHSNIATPTKRLHNTTSTLLTYTETLILTILNPILRPFTKYSTKLCNILRTFLVNTAALALILNPILISSKTYANLPTGNHLNDGHINNLNPHVETTAGAIRIDGTTNTGLDNAQNGVPVVNIATPSSGGVSKNNFTDFNVGGEGVIMNNSNQIATSKLGGALCKPKP